MELQITVRLDDEHSELVTRRSRIARSTRRSGIGRRGSAAGSADTRDTQTRESTFGVASERLGFSSDARRSRRDIPSAFYCSPTDSIRPTARTSDYGPSGVPFAGASRATINDTLLSSTSSFPPVSASVIALYHLVLLLVGGLDSRLLREIPSFRARRCRETRRRFRPFDH